MFLIIKINLISKSLEIFLKWILMEKLLDKYKKLIWVFFCNFIIFLGDGGVRQFNFSKDYAMMATCGADGARLWNPEDLT